MSRRGASSGSQRNVLSMVPWTLNLVWHASPTLGLTSIVLTTIQGLLPGLTLHLTRLIIDGAVAAAQASSQESRQRLILLITIWLIVQCLSVISTSLGSLVTGIQRDLISHRVNVLLLEHANRLDLSHFENAAYYDRLETARREASYRPGLMVDQIVNLVRNFITLLSVAFVLISLAWWLLALVTLTALPTLLTEARHSNRAHQLMTKRAPTVRRMQYLHWLLTTDVAAKELRVFGMQQFLLDRYQRLFIAVHQDTRTLLIGRGSSSIMTGALAVIVAGIGYVYIVNGVLIGSLTLGALALFYQALQQTQQTVSGIALNVAGVYEHTLFVSNLREFLAITPTLQPEHHSRSLPTRIGQQVTFKSVSFRYPNAPNPVLNDVSFTLKPDTTTALVGLNGAGKTTLVKLLTRLYEPSSGSISIDGVPLREVDPAAYRNRIAAVFQDFLHYQFTLGENIRLAAADEHNEEQIRQAAALAGLAPLVEELPMGYETPVGNWFENGHELSIGQWQKVALARAFARDAELLILDEPTASLDPRSELELFQRLKTLRAGRMTLIISHRFSTVRLADQIIVLDKGRIIEQGPHDALMSQRGLYAELYELQASAYR